MTHLKRIAAIPWWPCFCCLRKKNSFPDNKGLHIASRNTKWSLVIAFHSCTWKQEEEVLFNLMKVQEDRKGGLTAISLMTSHPQTHNLVHACFSPSSQEQPRLLFLFVLLLYWFNELKFDPFSPVCLAEMCRSRKEYLNGFNDTIWFYLSSSRQENLSCSAPSKAMESQESCFPVIALPV